MFYKKCEQKAKQTLQANSSELITFWMIFLGALKNEKYAKVMQNGNMQAKITDNESELCDQNEEVPLSLGGWYSE